MPNDNQAAVFPAVLYHPDGKTTRVENTIHEASLEKVGWRRKPYPPQLIEVPASLQAQIDALRDRVEILGQEIDRLYQLAKKGK